LLSARAHMALMCSTSLPSCVSTHAPWVVAHAFPVPVRKQLCWRPRQHSCLRMQNALCPSLCLSLAPPSPLLRCTQCQREVQTCAGALAPWRAASRSRRTRSRCCALAVLRVTSRVIPRSTTSSSCRGSPRSSVLSCFIRMDWIERILSGRGSQVKLTQCTSTTRTLARSHTHTHVHTRTHIYTLVHIRTHKLSTKRPTAGTQPAYPSSSHILPR